MLLSFIRIAFLFLLFSPLISTDKSIHPHTICHNVFFDKTCPLSEENKALGVEDNLSMDSLNYFVYLFWGYAADFSPDYFKMNSQLNVAQKVARRDQVQEDIRQTIIRGKHFDLSTACTDTSADCYKMMDYLVSRLESIGATADIRVLSFNTQVSAPHRIRKESGMNVAIVDSNVFKKKLFADHYNENYFGQAYGIYQWAAYHPERNFVPIETLLQGGDLVFALKAIEYQRNLQDGPALFFRSPNTEFFNSFMVLNPLDRGYFYEKIALIFVDSKVYRKQYTFTNRLAFEDMEFMGLQTQILTYIYRSDPLGTNRPLLLTVSEDQIRSRWDSVLYKRFRENGKELKENSFHVWDQKYMEHFYFANEEYRETFHTPHLHTYQWITNPNAKNAVITFGHSLSKGMIEFSRYFMISFKRYYPNDDLILFGDQLTINVLKNFASEIELDVNFIESDEKMHNTKFPKYNNLMRGANYFYWLKNNKDYKNVFLVDFTDIYFQGNVFDDIPSSGPYLQFNYLDQFDVFKVSFNYDSWVKIFMISDKLIRYFGAYQAREYEKEHMLCGGTIIGDPTSLMTLYTILNNMAEIQNFDSKSDQVFLVFTMFHFGSKLFKNVDILPNGNKIFMFKLYPDELCNNCHLITQNNGTYFIDGYEREPRVVHKLNRFFDSTRKRLMNSEQKKAMNDYLVANFGKYAKSSLI